ncbi:efflux RND transporter periplasmic adaptor subunit [Paraglaciecola sp. MB-3u-78]|jgi:RND family efflux transporter MFP subunit|uniref:efflux RND transporter periplasmic adaptor subunit n=1 Tax=Paraglaciecola sp. MB-3u-78 TaxID=2058332 RepID=UPI000C325178|nr:efflux RND transporter periplasmic adaptor subunit [Paraglaciecola sp. MB-3u-78]PKG93255.1 efflux transporter periplasmic adaptor subunit [Paraglaciecola sp. MB-3u-78]
MLSRLFTLISMLVSFGVLMLTLPAAAQYRGADRPRIVVVERISFEYETSKIEAVGSAQAKRAVTLFASVSDEVTSLNFVPGQAVKKDDVLLELDSRLQDVNMQRAEIELADAQKNLKRVKNSFKKGAVTEREVDDANTLFRLAGVSLLEAQKNIEDRLVRAPFDGIVGLTDVEAGDRITPQTEITTLDDRTRLFVNFVAPELAVSYLMEKPMVQLQPWTDRLTLLPAKVVEVDSRVSLQDRTIRARAQLDNLNDQYRPGMSFRVTLEVRGELYIAIPEAALSWGANGAFVWLAENEKAKRVDVQIEQRLRGRILVTGNLTDGETLIVEGIQGLRDGQALSIQNILDSDLKLSQKQAAQKVAG